MITPYKLWDIVYYGWSEWKIVSVEWLKKGTDYRYKVERLHWGSSIGLYSHSELTAKETSETASLKVKWKVLETKPEVLDTSIVVDNVEEAEDIEWDLESVEKIESVLNAAMEIVANQSEQPQQQSEQPQQQSWGSWWQWDGESEQRKVYVFTDSMKVSAAIVADNIAQAMEFFNNDFGFVYSETYTSPADWKIHEWKTTPFYY